jgi:hypothetical protein
LLKNLKAWSEGFLEAPFSRNFTHAAEKTPFLRWRHRPKTTTATACKTVAVDNLRLFGAIHHKRIIAL